MAVRNDKLRRKAPSTVELVSPNGSEIEVSAERAEVFLARVPVQRGDGTWHRYAYRGESTQVTGDDANAALVESLKRDDTEGTGPVTVVRKGGDK